MTKYDNIPGFPGYYISKRGGLWSNRKNGALRKKMLNNAYLRVDFLKMKSFYLINKSQIQLEIS